MLVEALRQIQATGSLDADLKQYAEDERYPCTEPADAEAIFRKHHIFLLMCFLNRAHGIGWSNTPIYQFLRRQYPVRNAIHFDGRADISIDRL
jgi:hypothetical protein